MSAPRQMFPPLEKATEAALRASIKRFGVLVPIAVDQHDEILDGHHRVRIANELDIDYAKNEHEIRDEDHARELSATLNFDRRQLSPEQRREVVLALRQDGHSGRAIAAALRVGETTVRSDLSHSQAEDRQLRGPAQLPDRVTGLDGKSRPATQRQQDIEGAAGRKLAKALAGIHGYCLGLEDFKLHLAIAGATSDDIAAWEQLAGDAAITLNTLKRALRKALE